MAWWNQIGTLTSLGCFDALSDNGTALTEKSGLGTTMNRNGQSLGTAFSVSSGEGYNCVVGTGGNMDLSSVVTAPTDGLFIALVRPRGSIVLNTNAATGSSHIGAQNVAAYGYRWYSNVSGTLSPLSSTPYQLDWQVIAYKFNSTQHQLFINDSFTIPVVNTGVPNFGGIIYGSGYSLNADLAAWGLFSGTCTLTDIQDIATTMRSSLAFTNTVPTTRTTLEPFIDNVSSYMPLNGSLIDVTGKTWTGTDITYGTAKFNQGAIFNGTSSYLTIPTVTGSSLDIATGDFTVEAWINLNASTTGVAHVICGRFDNSSNDVLYDFYVNGDLGSIIFNWSVDGQLGGAHSVVTTGTFAFSTGTDYHVEAVRSGTTLTIYVNGTSVGSSTVADSTYVGSTPTRIGCIYSVGLGSLGYWFKGTISQFRITKAARHTANFTPETSPFDDDLELMINNRNCVSLLNFDDGIRDASGVMWEKFAGASISDKQSVFGGSSLYLDGNSYLATKCNPDAFNFGTGDFTIEFWTYKTGEQAGNCAIFGTYGAVGANPNSGGLYVCASTSGSAGAAVYKRVTIYSSDNNTFLISTTMMDFNQWYHVAVTRRGAKHSVYINGTLEATANSSSIVWDFSGQLSNALKGTCIGNAGGSGAKWIGFIDKLRVIKGVSRYNGNFIPTSATKMIVPTDDGSLVRHLLKFDNSIEDRTGRHITNTAVVQTVGAYTGSLGGAFNGNNTSIMIPPQFNNFLDDRNTMSGDFTIEGYLNFQGAPSKPGDANSCGMLVASTNSPNTSYYWAINNTGTGLIFGYSLNGTSSGSNFYTFAGAFTFTIGTYYHVALTKNRSTLQMFVNGTSILKTSCLTNYGYPDYATTIGKLDIGGNNNPLYGNLDDVKITAGRSLYNSNFTPTFAQTMPYESLSYTDTYSDGCETNFHKTINSNGDANPFAIYNPIYGSIDYEDTTNFYGFNFNKFPYSTNFCVTIDMQLAADASTRKHLGVILNSQYTDLLRFTHLDLQWDYGVVFSSSSTFGGIISSGYNINDTINPIVNGTRFTMKIYYGILNGSGTVYAFINNTLVYVRSGFTPVARKPGIFVYGCKARIFSINVVNTDISTIDPLGEITKTTIGDVSVDSWSIPGLPSSGSITKTQLYQMNHQNDIYTMGSNVISGFIEGTTTPSDIVLYSEASASRPIQFVNNSTNYSFNVVPGKYTIKYNDTYKHVNLGQTMSVGSISGTVSTTACSGSNLYIKCFRTFDNLFIGNYQIAFDGTYTIPNLDVGSSYDIVLVDTDGIVENQVSSMRAGNGTSFNRIQSALVLGGFGGSEAYGTVTYAPYTAGEVYYLNTSLLLHFDGTNGDTTFVNNNKQFTVTSNGGAALSNSQSKFGSTSLSLNGTTQYLSFPTSSSLNMGTGDFTVEAWIYLNSVSGFPTIMATGSTSWSPNAVTFRIDGSSSLLAFYSNDGSAYVLGHQTAVTTGAWHHVALTRCSNIVRLFYDGVVSTSTTTMPNNIDFGTVQTLIGKSGWDGAPGFFNGYIDELRVSKGIARYITSFTPAIAAYRDIVKYDYLYNKVVLELPMVGANGSTTFGDESSSHLTVTPVNGVTLSTAQFPAVGLITSSASFNGTNQYLSIPSNSVMNFGSNDFTIEFWVYINALDGTYQGIIASNYPSWQTNAVNICVGANGAAYANRIIFNLFGRGPDVGSTVITSNVWYHIAFSRQGNTLMGFVNGTLETSAALSSAIDFSYNYTSIGSSLSGATSFNGHVAGLRVVNGRARYTSSFSPPVQLYPVLDFQGGSTPLFSGGDTLTGWNVGGATINSTGGPTAGPCISVQPSFTWANINPGGLTDFTGNSIKFDVRVSDGSGGLCNFSFACNSGRTSGNAMRFEARSGYTGGIGSNISSGWSAAGGGTNMVASFPRIDTFWHTYQLDFKTGNLCDLWIDGIVMYSNMPFNNAGGYIGMNGDGGASGGMFANILVFTTQ